MGLTARPDTLIGVALAGAALWYLFCLYTMLKTQRDYLADELALATWENTILYERLSEHGRTTT